MEIHLFLKTGSSLTVCFEVYRVGPVNFSGDMAVINLFIEIDRVKEVELYLIKDMSAYRERGLKVDKERGFILIEAMNIENRTIAFVSNNNSIRIQSDSRMLLQQMFYSNNIRYITAVGSVI